MRYRIITFLLLLVFTSGRAQDPSSSYIGKAGSEFITEEEFVKRFELMPGLNRKKGGRLEEEKVVVLYSIIAEKLLAQEAVDRGLDRDSLFLEAYDDVERALLRDELYREEVAGKVRVSAAEMREGLSQAIVQKEVAYRFFERREDAEFVRRQIKSGKDFLRMQVDSLMAAPIDTATVMWSDAEPAIEKAAYALHTGEVSPVVEAGTGYYILYLRGEGPNTHYTGMTMDVRRQRVQERLRLRKEKGRLDVYMREVMKDKDAHARPEPFKRLAAALTAVLAGSVSSGEQHVLTPEAAVRLRERCADVLSDTLAAAGETFWSMGQIIDRLAASGFGIRTDDVQKTGMKLNNQLRVWVQQEVLTQEAARRRLGSRPSVRRDLEMWRTSFLATVLKRELQRRTRATDAEAYAHARSRDPEAVAPQVQLRELRTGSIADMQRAMDDLESRVSFEEVIQRWSNDPRAKEHGGLTEPFSVTQRPPVGEIAAGMQEGDFYGPVNTDGGWLYFQLVGRERGERSDTTVAARLEEARRQVQAMKERRTLARLIAQVAQRKGFSIYEDRLRSLKVSPIPMMTFRSLGFGGRLFAVPMTYRQIDWLDVEPPAAPVLP